MDKRPTGPSETNQQHHKTIPPQTTSMSMLTMTASSPHAAFKNDFAWDALRSSEYSRPLTSSKPIALPSIRQAFPELNLTAQPLPSDALSRPSSAVTSPNSGVPGGALTSPEYALASTGRKRRRSSIEEAADSMRPRQVPRLLGSPDYGSQQAVSPPLGQHAQPTDSWTAPAGPTPHSPNSFPPPPPPAVAGGPPKYRTPFPPPAEYEKRTAEDEYPAPHRASYPAASYPEPGYGYSYIQPARYQPLPPVTDRAFERLPYPKESFGGTPRHQYTRFGDLGGISGDKHRKRRGNLPKATTDKLRTWFLSHLAHPYPTEDEKQDLMRQTGLQMNQISNWFINARRRQLPTMINNARAEADVMNSRGSASEGQQDAHDDRRRFARLDGRNGHYSEGESVSYDDEIDRSDRGGHMERGSV